MVTPKKEGKPTRAEQKRQKVSAIFAMALSMLREGGVERLTMRALAERLDMSLSNLQYHYKNKDILLAALLTSFLDEYLQTSWRQGGRGQGKLEEIFHAILTHPSYEDCAVVFKEVWALSHRNPALETALAEYYTQVRDLLAHMVRSSEPDTCTPETALKVAGILLPFFEGYCVTRSAVSPDPAILAHTLSQMVGAILKDSA